MARNGPYYHGNRTEEHDDEQDRRTYVEDEKFLNELYCIHERLHPIVDRPMIPIEDVKVPWRAWESTLANPMIHKVNDTHRQPLGLRPGGHQVVVVGPSFGCCCTEI